MEATGAGGTIRAANFFSGSNKQSKEHLYITNSNREDICLLCSSQFGRSKIENYQTQNCQQLD